jgi:hypothetical protein
MLIVTSGGELAHGMCFDLLECLINGFLGRLLKL